MGKIMRRADGRYQVKVRINGKQVFFYGVTQKDAKKKADAYRTAVGAGLDPAQASKTFGAIYDNLVSVKRAKGIGVKSMERLTSSRAHWGALLDRPASEIRAADFQRVLNRLADWHDGRAPLAHWTLANLRATAKAAYTLAIPEIVQYNPLDKVTIPAGTPKKTREPLSKEQQGWVRETPHRAQKAAMLMMYAGLRRGEATALTWADVDIPGRAITVNKSFDFGSQRIKAPKTAAGNRTVNIPAVLADYLAGQKDGCLYVLHNDKGQMLSEQAWKRMWQSYMCDLNIKYGYSGEVNKHAARQKDARGQAQGSLPMRIKPFTAHQLRHTFCTLLYLAGVDIMTARDQMGHSDIKVTLEIYTHLDKKYKRSSMDKLDNYLSGSQVVVKNS